MNRPPVLVLGGRSDIGLAAARVFARRGHAVRLAARDAARLSADAADIALRWSVACTVHEFDVLDTAGHAAFLDALPEVPGVAVSVVGLLGDEGASARDPAAAALVLRTNFEGPALLLGRLAERMDANGGGVLVGVSSVSGDRGRARTHVYGAAKAGFSAYLSGLRNRMTLAGGRVRVVTVKPGFVATRMTEGMDLPPLLTATPEAVGAAIVAAVDGGRDVVYVGTRWRLVMAAIRLLPEPVFKRMRI